MAEQWLNLSQAAKVLGIHPSTVRSWADHGGLPCTRTQGGHRRFRREDVEMWIRPRSNSASPEASSVIAMVMRSTRLQISEGQLENQSWYQKLDEEARNQYRMSGRSLVQGLVSHLTTSAEGMEAEARSLGYEYASRGRRFGLSIIEAGHAFLFFRRAVFESILSAYEESAVRSPQVWAELFRKITAFSDLIMITLLETYEAYQRSGR